MDVIGQGYCENNQLCVWVETPTKVGKKLLKYSFPEVRIANQSFLETAWLHYCSTSRRSEPAYLQAVAGLQCLPSMSEHHTAFVIRILGSRPDKPPTRNEMREFFSVIEQAIKISKSHISALRPLVLNSRKLFWAGIDAWFDSNILSFRYHDIKNFLDPLPPDKRSSSLTLSSFEDTSSQAPGAITDITFKTITEARDKQAKHLDTRLAELQEKCFQALTYWETRKAALTTLAAILTSKRYAEIQQVLDPHRKGWSEIESERSALNAIDSRELGAFYVTEFLQEELHVYVKMQSFISQYKTVYPHGDRVANYFSDELIKGFSGKKSFLPDLLCSLSYFGSAELVAIQVLILSETGFNPQPLQDLHISQCEREKGQTARWRLMPIKKKTGKSQDQALDSADEGLEDDADYIVKHASQPGQRGKKTAFDAMEMLISNYDRLRGHWACAPHSEGYLFCYPNRLEGFRAQRRIGTWGKVFDKFKLEWNINPNYTFKHLRSQVGCQVVVRSNGNLFEVRNKLGQSDIATSAGYVAQVLTGLDEAIINQFERQIAATIMFAIGGDDALYTHQLQREDINVKTIPIVTLQNRPVRADEIKQKLTAVGNGVGCMSPTESPNHTIKSGEVCDGEQCHDCKQQKIIITEGRMKENILMLRYFRDHLEEICSRNSEHWIKHGVKAFAFQIALSHVIRNNIRYKSLYEEIERQVTKEQGPQFQTA